MNSLYLENEAGLTAEECLALVRQSLQGLHPKKALLLPPDITRLNSGVFTLTEAYYHLLEPECHVDVMPATGTHFPMTRQEQLQLFPTIPEDRFLIHNHRHDVVKLGEVPGSFVEEVSEGLLHDPIDVEINHRLLDGGYDLILSLGQVVPHEVVGMANYSKNVFVGCGGQSMIDGSHMLGAFYGMERIMGQDFSPVRKVLDYAETHMIADLPLMYVLTVTTTQDAVTRTNGLYIGRERALFERAVALSQKLNFIRVEKPLQKCVVYLDPREFRSTWLGNKSIYRTRMAMADGGELLILAPGIEIFGEDAENDRVIRKYGYCGRMRILDIVKEEEDLASHLSVAAHLIHGSSDGRFCVTYAAPKLGKETVESVHFRYADYEEMVQKYDPARLHDGWNLVEGEEVFFISNPALGLWKK